ncbi:MAG: putative Ig domain-containing protein, partial [Verrucomicrobia bacterium]|nr:putative Ig domain-containing protein [Verrucomicrobiota bacterium]
SPFEASSTTGVNSTPDELASSSGAVYVFVRSGTSWSQQAYLKASNTGSSDQFGYSVAVSGDTVVVGSPFEASSTTGVNSTPDELASSSGAVYVFVRSGTVWSQQVYLKASNTGAGDNFGYSVGVSGDTVVVGAPQEASSTTGVNSTPNELARFSGAVYVFLRSGTVWSQQVYLKASNTGTSDDFGYSVAVSGDTVVVGAPYEDSSTTGVSSTPNESAAGAGAAYVFSIINNEAPVLAVALTNQMAVYNSVFSYTFPAGTFTDPDTNTLSYTASGLPGGITLNSDTRTFSGTPTAAGSNWVTLVASDSSLTATNTFAIVVGRVTPSVTTWPAAAIIGEGQALSASTLTGGSASIPGGFAWTISLTTPPVGTNLYNVTFTATDAGNYNTVTGSVSVAVVSAPSVTTLAASLIASNCATLGASINPGGSADLFFQYGRSTNLAVVVSTLAGSTSGFADGTGAAAHFNSPYAVAVDASGNVYVADSLNNRIRKVAPAGSVTTLAGSGIAGSADGVGAAAKFNFPQGVAVDAAGNVYVADGGTHCIRKVTPEGVVTTLAGSGAPGFANGTGAAVQFNAPNGVAVDSSGNIYVADMGNNRIRKVTPEGVATTLAGLGTSGFADGPAATAQFRSPYGVAVDASGNVYVADSFNNRIRKVTTNGVVSTLAGSGTYGFADGSGAVARFSAPFGVAVDAGGNVYVADYLGNRIRKVTPEGVVTTFAGSGTSGFVDGTPPEAMFSSPFSVAADTSGNVYVADMGNNRIRKIGLPSILSVVAQTGLVGNNALPASLVVTGLVPETTYYFRAMGTNAAGTNYGEFLSFRTLGVNQAPVLASGLTNLSGTYNAAFSYTFPAGTFTDPDTNTLSYTASGLPVGITLISDTRTFSGTPTAAGSNWVRLVASDGLLTAT